MQQLSGQDASFLYFETAKAHLGTQIFTGFGLRASFEELTLATLGSER